MSAEKKLPTYYGLVSYDSIEDIISSCENALAVYDECLEISEPKTLSRSHLLGAKSATETILKQLKAIHPINIK